MDAYQHLYLKSQGNAKDERGWIDRTPSVSPTLKAPRPFVQGWMCHMSFIVIYPRFPRSYSPFRWYICTIVVKTQQPTDPPAPQPVQIAFFSVSLLFKYKLDIPPPSSSVYHVTCCKQIPFHQSNGHFPSWYKQKAYVVRVESDSIIWTHDLLPPLFCRTPIVVFHIVFINARIG